MNRNIDNPIASWTNPDLLFDQEQREFFSRHHPKLLPIFDWPELRHLFAAHNVAAAAYRRRNRLLAILAIALGLAGAVIAALSPMFENEMSLTLEIRRLLGVIGFSCISGSAVLAYSHILSGKDKAGWLAHRFWTERLRQLYFQLIANNIGKACVAMRGGEGISAWANLRADVLDHLQYRELVDLAEAVRSMEADLAEAEPWLQPSWQSNFDDPELTEDAKALFTMLGEQRFDIQSKYAATKLASGLYSSKTRSTFISITSDCLTIAILLLAFASGVILSLGAALDAELLRWAGVVASIFGCIIAGLQVLDKGLRFSEEAARYEWYFAAVTAAKRRYDVATTGAEKIRLLRELERLSYQELRRFTISFKTARFVM